MKITQAIKNVLYNISYKRKEKQLEKLDKSIEMMTIDEISLELRSKLSRINKINEIDNRTEELLNHVLDFGNNKYYYKMNNLYAVLRSLKTNDLKLEFFDKFSSKLDDSMLQGIVQREEQYNKIYMKSVYDDAKVKRERGINRIKEILHLNSFKSLNERDRLDRENAELQEGVIAKIFAKNYERIDVYSFLENESHLSFYESQYPLIKKICDELPEDIKGIFLMEYFAFDMYTENFIPEEQEQIEKYILERVPIDTLKHKINVNNEIKTANDLISKLRYITNDGYYRNYRNWFFRKAIYKLPDEEKRKLLLSDEMEDEYKIDIGTYMLRNKSDSEKLEIYENLLLNSGDEKVKNNYRIYIAQIRGEYDEIFKIIRSGKYDYHNLDISDDILLRFSDEQLKEIYDTTEYYILRNKLLTLTRRNNDSGFENENQDDKIPEFILVNKENYTDFIKNAKSYGEIVQLLSIDFENYKKELTFEHVLELCKNFCNKELKYLNTYIKEEEKYLATSSKRQDITIKQDILNIIIEEFDVNAQNLYENLLDSSDIDISNKYFILSRYMESYFRGGYTPDEKFIQKFVPKFEKINELASKSEYSKIFDFFAIYKNNEKTGKHQHIEDYYNMIEDYYNMIECIKYLDSDIVYDKLRYLYNQNHSVIQHINPLILKDGVIQLLNDNIIEFVSRYTDDDSSYFGKILEDENKAIFFINTYDRLKNIKAYSEEDALKIASFIHKLDVEDFMKDDTIDEKNIDLIIAIALSEDLEKEFSEVKKDKDTNKLEKFVDNIKERTDKKIHSKLLTRRQALDAIGTRFFGLSYNEMQDFVNKYAVDLDEIIKKYQDKSEQNVLTAEEQNELIALKTIRNIKEILAIQDKKALVETYEELDKLEEFENIDFASLNVLDENTRRVYAKNYKESIYNLREEDKLQEKIDGIDVYSPKEFNMLVHVVAAYGDFKLIDEENPEKSAKEAWKNVDNKQNHVLCTSYIGNSNLCYARTMENDKETKDETNIIFGFSNFSKNSVLMVAPYDIGSYTTSMQSNISANQSSFRTAKNLLKFTRWNHNEVCIERRLENQKDTNIEPDYIVCFDEIDEKSKKVAKDFNIPIVLIDTREVAKNESTRLNEELKEFYSTNNASKIEEILNTYQTNLNSFSNFKSELVEEFFNPSKMNEEFEKIIQKIDREYKIGDRDNAVECYKKLYEAFQNEINLNLQVELDPEVRTNGEFSIRNFNCIARQKFEQVKHHLKKSTVQKDSLSENRVKEDKAFEIVSEIKERMQDYDRQ